VFERAEAVQHPAVGVLAVADRQDDGVALVALDSLQVLDEERLRPSASLGAVLEEFVEVRARQADLPQSLDDPVGVLDAHGDHPEAFVGPRLGVPDDQLDHALDLVGDGVLLADAAGSPRDEFVPDAVVDAGAWERRERPVVQRLLRVREGDEALVARAVVPGEGLRPERARQQRPHDFEDGLDVLRERDVRPRPVALLFERLVVLAAT
jgi:hypothetical protein